MTRIVTPSSESEMEGVRALMRAFVSWHLERHARDVELINKYFDRNEFEEELRTLPGIYREPEGSLLLAYQDDIPAGCVALKPIDDSCCEMKRMFVFTQFHGKGIGKALGRAIVEKARTAGYSRMYLDTSVNQAEAQTLYRSLGFAQTKPYYELPPELERWLVFMRLDL